ncbi:MAG TPA: TlpA family protein disulfide reductase [Thiomicrospira sp.]|nr:TlpA family protein disulfide reductase [Thiomicrospira sp.]
MTTQDNSQKQPFWKTDWGKNALVILAIVILYPFVHKMIIQEAAKGPAPKFETVTLQNKQVSLDDFQGEPVIIHFWATWCPICEHERPDIEKIAKEYSVVNIAIQSGSDQELIEFAEKNSMDPAIIVNDKNKYLENLYSAHGVPATFLVDSQGQVQFVKRGYTSYKELSEQIEKLSE